MEEGSAENQPSTSADGDRRTQEESLENKTDDEMTKLLQATDEILENKAKSMNLSSLNVRSILHHLIKYPSTIDVLLGIRETDDLPSVRNMRSRKKPEDSEPSSSVNTPKKIAIRIEDRRPKNFLDVEYAEDDEYDADYTEERDDSQKEADLEGSDDEEENYEDEEEDEDEDGECEPEIGVGAGKENQTENESGVAEPSANTENPDLDELLFEEDLNESGDLFSMNLTLNTTRPGSAAMVHTLDNVVDDDDYRNFVFSIQHPQDDWISDDDFQAVYDAEDDAEDEDYNVITDNLNVEDWDETRQDKTTMIPRHEVKALMMDTLLAEREIPYNVFPQEMQKAEPKKTQKDKDAENRERINESVNSSTESCTLLQPIPVTFRPEEIEQLQLQLEQHVQLLTQFVVTCHHDDSLAHVRNNAQLMMNQLDDMRQQKQFSTILDVANLDHAIQACHDINSFPQVDPNLLNYAKNTDGLVGDVLRPEAAAVLSKTEAIRFPSLLPLCQPIWHEQRLSHFLNEEDIMLAIALIQFSHLPRRSEKNTVDRYSMISRHCLPARTAYQIRTHLKSLRRGSGKNPIHGIIQAAEAGVSMISSQPGICRRTSGAIITWPKFAQPAWCREFQKIFNVTEDYQIHRKNDATMVLTPIKNTKESEETSATDENSGEALTEFVDIGRGADGRKIVLSRNQIEILMRQLIEQSNLSPSKRRKNPAPMKLSTMKQLEEEEEEFENQPAKSKTPTVSDSTEIPPSTSSKAVRQLNCSNPTDFSSINEELKNSKPSTTAQPTAGLNDNKVSQKRSPPRTLLDISDYHATTDKLNQHDWPSSSCSSFPIPPTPGRRSPEDFDNDDFLDLESNSLMWTKTAFSVTQGNPLTPRGFSLEPEEADPIDFSAICAENFNEGEDLYQYSTYDCQQPMEYSPYMEDRSNSNSIPESFPSSSSEQRNIYDIPFEDDLYMPGLDMVPPEYEYEEVMEGMEVVEEIADEAEVKLEVAGEVEVVTETTEHVKVKNVRRQTNMRAPFKYLKEIKAGVTAMRASRKRTRAEREAMGIVGLEDEAIHEYQKKKVMHKVIEDVGQKLFMHKDTYKRFKKAITNDKLSDIEKVSRVILVLANHPELLNLVLLYAPREAVISDFESHTSFQSYKVAMEMIMDIERYITAANLKEPTLRALWRFIQGFLKENPDLTDEEATKKFYQLFGQDRPLWKKLESHFWCLPFRGKPRLENFEYVDLSGIERTAKRDRKDRKDWYNYPPRFETIDSIDHVLEKPFRPSRSDPPSNLVVKCGELCIRKDEETFIQLEIHEKLWARTDDIKLLTTYNRVVSTPNFKDTMIPEFVPELPFGEKSIVARLRYLLSELKTETPET